MNPNIKKWMPAAIALALAGAGYFYWASHRDNGPGEGFISGNGRIEATEVDVATKLPGRVQAILVDEGAFVKAGQPLARMDISSLQAQRDEAAARQAQAKNGVDTARAQVALRESDVRAAEAQVAARAAELDAAQRRLARSTTLEKEGASSGQELDDDRARVRSQQAALDAAKAQATGATSSVDAAVATVARIDAELQDAQLVAPRDGRVQFLVAQPGEVLGAGGKVLNLVDLSDVYMTFFLPETVAGRVALGTEVRLVLDAAPQYVIPAQVSFVASTAQFTPKTVQTASERQKLMFRVNARIDRALLAKHLEQVKTGLPGVAWVRLDAQQPWPANLANPVQP